LATQIRLPGGSAGCGLFGFHIREQSSWGLPLDQTYFAWCGPASPLGAAYWRVTGPMVLLEFVRRCPLSPLQPAIEPVIGLLQRNFGLLHLHLVTSLWPAQSVVHHPLHLRHDAVVEDPVEHPHLERGAAIIWDEPDRAGVRNLQMLDDNARCHYRPVAIHQKREFADGPELSELGRVLRMIGAE
jgi:hypothetical protein